MVKTKHDMYLKLSLTLLILAHVLATTNGLDSPSSKTGRPWPFKKLNKPVVLMISCDGFRFGYQFKTDTPNIDLLIFEGTEVKSCLIPIFPTMTFPNHYSIATGLYPAYHGIIMNSFTDPVTGDKFNKGLDPKWWLGEPLWVTAANQGRKAVTYFWPGSEVPQDSWTCPKELCPHYNSSVTFEEVTLEVDKVLSYFDLPQSDIPDFLMLYFDQPDKEGHEYGPDDPRVTAAVGRVDRMIGRVIQGLKKREIFDEVNVILLGDHGMVTNCDMKTIYIDDLAEWVKIPADWINAYSPSRIPPIVGMVGEGLIVRQNRTGVHECYGDHGYDNKYFSMRSIFIGHGPRFRQGKKVPSFENVQIYNVVAEILGLRPASNNGSSLFTRSILSSSGETGEVE
ncbi:hypothetical protein Bca4012_007961 [Brassica carinata]|uniref:Uncharacterized protein n=1 Tax=Brassica carinata TaxID=52824 RepID=A0A8X7RMS6_BRACI|nr:hypothetical protein Bca52824_038648 [Brassica carinata]